MTDGQTNGATEKANLGKGRAMTAPIRFQNIVQYFLLKHCKQIKYLWIKRYNFLKFYFHIYSRIFFYYFLLCLLNIANRSNMSGWIKRYNFLNFNFKQHTTLNFFHARKNTLKVTCLGCFGLMHGQSKQATCHHGPLWTHDDSQRDQYFSTPPSPPGV